MLATYTTAYAGMSVLMIVAGVFALILAILWILVPFAVFGIKGLLRQLIAEQRRTNDLLTRPPVVAPAAVPVADPVAPRDTVYVRQP